MPDNKSKVFLSYSRRDMQVVNALAKDLEEAGIDVWIDRHDIAVGERWSTAIQKALEESYAMILVISPDSMASSNVEDEFTYFLDSNKPIVPIMIRPAKLHFQLHRLQWIDFTQGATEHAFKELMWALSKVGVEFQPDDEGERNPLIAQLLNSIEVDKQRALRRSRLMRVGLAVTGVVALLALVALLLILRPDPAEPTDPTRAFISGVVDGPDVRLYEQPSRDSRVLRTLPDGQPLFISKRSPDQRFVFITFGIDTGWVLARDMVIEDDLDEIAIFISPTPTPSASPTPRVSPTPTVTPSPTPEQVTGGGGLCVVSLVPTAQPKTAHFEPSVLAFSEFDMVYPNESFIATARSGGSWLYIGIGWVRPDSELAVNDPLMCDTLPEDASLHPTRLRRFIKDLGVVQQLRQGDMMTVRPIPTEGLTPPSFTVAEAWNRYENLLDPLAELLSIDQSLLTALVAEEATMTGSDQPENLLPIRFEADVFRRYLTKEQQVDFDIHFEINQTDPTQHAFRLNKSDPFVDYHTSTELEWEAFVLAQTLNPEAALRAVRYGANGVLGENHYLMGFVSPQAMYEAFLTDPVARIIAKLDYVKSQPGALEALRQQNWEAFALAFNGDDRIGYQVAAATQAYYQALVTLVV